MANDSNKVFVSPGVYTSERDLSFVAQSVGVTTLGLAGETLRGPAFEPILIIVSKISPSKKSVNFDILSFLIFNSGH